MTITFIFFPFVSFRQIPKVYYQVKVDNNFLRLLTYSDQIASPKV